MASSPGILPSFGLKEVSPMVRFKRRHCIAVLFLLLFGLPGALPGQEGGVMFLPAPIYPPDGNVEQEFPDQFVFLHHETLDLVLAYSTAPDEPRTVHLIERPLRMGPKIRSEVSAGPGAGYRYRYTVTNGPRNVQPIRAWLLPVPESQASHEAARSSSKKHKRGLWRQELYASRPGNWSVRFAGRSGSALLPDQSAVFSVDNENRPGIVQAYFHGTESSVGPLPADVPPEARKQLEEITANWGKTALWTIGPKFGSSATSREIARDFLVEVSMMMRKGILTPDGQAFGPFGRGARMAGNGTAMILPAYERYSDSPFVQEVLNRLNEFIDRPRPWEGIGELPWEVYESLAVNEPFPPIGVAPDPESSAERQLDAALKLALVNP